MPLTSFQSEKTLFQYFLKHQLDRENLITEDQWCDFVEDVQSDFAHEVTHLASALFQGYLERLED